MPVKIMCILQLQDKIICSYLLQYPLHFSCDLMLTFLFDFSSVVWSIWVFRCSSLFAPLFIISPYTVLCPTILFFLLKFCNSGFNHEMALFQFYNTFSSRLFWLFKVFGDFIQVIRFLSSARKISQYFRQKSHWFCRLCCATWTILILAFLEHGLSFHLFVSLITCISVYIF